MDTMAPVSPITSKSWELPNPAERARAVHQDAMSLFEARPQKPSRNAKGRIWFRRALADRQRSQHGWCSITFRIARTTCDCAEFGLFAVVHKLGNKRGLTDQDSPLLALRPFHFCEFIEKDVQPALG